ncbi:MAG: hypothetical protein CUN55_15365, partial [Phototrophicales bacterium]
MVCEILFSTYTYAENSIGVEDDSTIVIQLKWKHQFQFAGFYAALSQGYYAEEGYKVRLKEAGPGINPIEEVLKEKADYGVANSELILYHLKGEPVVALSAYIQHSPIVLLALKESQIASPKDLLGKRIMFPEGVYGSNTLGLLNKLGINQDQYTQVPLTYNVDDLINGKVDAMVAYVTDQPYQLTQRGIAYNIIDPKEYGIDFYDDVLFTTEDKLSSSRQEVEAIVRATQRGWQYAASHPNEIVQLIIDQYKSERSYNELIHEANATIELMVPKLVQVGHMNRERWESIASTYQSLGMAEGQFDPERFMFVSNDSAVPPLTRDLVQALTIVVLIGLCVIALMWHMNRRLKTLVAEKTMYLSKANRELMVYTKQLKQKEDELYQLNKELEQRIIGRTETINKINHELTQEIK